MTRTELLWALMCDPWIIAILAVVTTSIVTIPFALRDLAREHRQKREDREARGRCPTCGQYIPEDPKAES